MAYRFAITAIKHQFLLTGGLKATKGLDFLVVGKTMEDSVALDIAGIEIVAASKVGNVVVGF